MLTVEARSPLAEAPSSERLDIGRYSALLEPVAGRIRATETPSRAVALARGHLEDTADMFDMDMQTPFFEEAAYLWSAFPARVKSLGKYQALLIILLEQAIDAFWYGAFPRYRTDAEAQNDPRLARFTRTQRSFDVRFDYVQYYGHIIMRLPNSMRLRYRKARNHPGRYTQGLTTTRCKPAMAALLNDIAEGVASDLGRRRAPKLMVNSVLRSAAYQHFLATIGYVAPKRSAHVAGYAADIERGWYLAHDPAVGRSLERILRELAAREVVYAVDEGTHWHVCLNPAQIQRYELLFQRWASRPL